MARLTPCGQLLGLLSIVHHCMWRFGLGDLEMSNKSQTQRKIDIRPLYMSGYQPEYLLVWKDSGTRLTLLELTNLVLRVNLTCDLDVD